MASRVLEVTPDVRLVRKQFQLKQDSFTTLSEMKSTAFLVAFCFLILETQGATKVAPDHFFKMSAAQICKPYFLKCKQIKDISKCFQDVYYKCIPQYRNLLLSMERCATDASSDFQAVMSCLDDSAQA
ncbi:uncharacterized protein LOC141880355 [Acropora palmata]|uniref:uncharacterized protein LOC141880355 n=1 Tax=Acropora palmata TaxID=6131 RepID=UPI003DA0B3F8